MVPRLLRQEVVEPVYDGRVEANGSLFTKIINVPCVVLELAIRC